MLVGVPSPVIPSFTDGTVVHQADLNALASNLTNLYSYNQGAFNTQRPACMAVQTVVQAVTNSIATLVTFNSAPVNVGNMWVASQPAQITIQVAGIYYLFGQVRYAANAGATLGIVSRGNIMINGTTPGTNSVSNTDVPFMTAGNGPTSAAWFVSNLAVGATVYLDTLHNTGGTINTSLLYGGSFLSAFFIAAPT